MSKILVLVPMKPNLHPELKLICRENAQRLQEGSSGFFLDIKIDERGSGDGHVKNHNERVAHTAAIRQAMVDEYLTDHDYVLWWDADLTIIPNNLIGNLFSYYPDHEHAILAPWVYTENTKKDNDPCFYDTSGFIYKDHDGTLQKFNNHRPVITQGMVEHYYAYDMEGVGCCCIIPSQVYKLGAKHVPADISNYTDWYSVCQFAKSKGFVVLSLPFVLVWHADLNHYGEGWH